ncbi:MAG: ATP-dependent helicase, partial [Fibrobacter sp.]|nr:ATP-dependent helicase [Fibrobacter sp.]
KIRGLKEPSSKRVKDIIESDLNDLKATILQDDQMLKAMPGNVEPEVINKVLIPKIIKVRYPELTEDEVEEVRQHVVVDSVLKKAEIKETGDQHFIRMADTFVNIDDLHIDLIDRVNPFQKAFEVLSKSVTAKVLKVIQESIEATRIQMDFEEAKILWPKIQEFMKTLNREPSLHSNDPLERRMAECIVYLKEEKRKKAASNG